MGLNLWSLWQCDTYGYVLMLVVVIVVMLVLNLMVRTVAVGMLVVMMLPIL